MTDDGLVKIEGLAREGLTNEQISVKMGIHRDTLNEWCKQFPAISDALKRGKAPVDDEVENALLKRAKGGYELKEKRIEKWKDADGVEREHTVIITREVPADTTAQIFWLKNRRPDLWRDRHENDVNIVTANHAALDEAFEAMKGEAQ